MHCDETLKSESFKLKERERERERGFYTFPCNNDFFFIAHYKKIKNYHDNFIIRTNNLNINKNLRIGVTCFTSCKVIGNLKKKYENKKIDQISLFEQSI